jgi:GNAT superfamily N-acetyltransferase
VHVFHPASVEEAHTLLAASPLPVDSLTQRRIRTDQSLSDYFEAGRRRPEWVWGVRRDDDPTPLGVVGAFGTPDGRMLLDVFGVPDDPETARALVARATQDVLAMPENEHEVCIFAPPGARVGDSSLARLVGPLSDAGWRLFVERRHNEFEPLPGLGTDVPTHLRFERLGDATDPRLVSCHREVMRDTLDAHDADAISRLGFDAACAESLRYLVTADPVECIHLAYDERGDVVGMVSGDDPTDGRAAVLFVGVAHDHRGHGYGGQLLAWQTQRLLAAGATTLIADTDNANVPMARGFAAVGWPQTETRIDLVLRAGS